MRGPKIARVKEDHGKIHFKIKSGSGAEADVVLTKVTEEIVDPSDFGNVPHGATGYQVKTNEPDRMWQAMWDESEKRLLLTATTNQINNYQGSLGQCILQAYEDGTLRASPK